MPHIGSKHRYTFYPAIGGLVTRWMVGEKRRRTGGKTFSLRQRFAGG